MINEPTFASVCLMARACQQGVMLQTLNGFVELLIL